METRNVEIYRAFNSGKTAKFDKRMVRLLTLAARAFAEQGYEKTSIRDVARVTGSSLAGLYYYVSCKEELLFLIQYHTFGVLSDELEKILAKPSSPEIHLQQMVKGHVNYLVEHLPELKICVAELDSLQGKYYEQVLIRRQRYFELTRRILSRMKDEEPGANIEPNLAALYLFGMLNWIVMWFDPKRNDPGKISENLVSLFLNGYRKKFEILIHRKKLRN